MRPAKDKTEKQWRTTRMKRSTWLGIAATAAALIPVLAFGRPCDGDGCGLPKQQPTIQPAATAVPDFVDDYPGDPNLPNVEGDNYPGQPPTAQPAPSGTYSKYFYINTGAATVTIYASFVDNSLSYYSVQTSGYEVDEYTGATFNLYLSANPRVFLCGVSFFPHDDGTRHIALTNGCTATETTN